VRKPKADQEVHVFALLVHPEQARAAARRLETLPLVRNVQRMNSVFHPIAGADAEEFDDGDHEDRAGDGRFWGG